MSEYAGICVNMSKFVWMAFVLYFPIVIPCQLEGVVTILTFTDENEGDFLDRRNLI